MWHFSDIDDIFILFKCSNKILFSNYMLEINNIHPKINFTHEKETDLSINTPIISDNPSIYPIASIVYLDIKAYRCNIDGFITCIYAKPFANTAPTHWRSCHPKHQKIGLISLIAFRISTLCSNTYLIKTFLGIHYNLFIQQGYPKSAVIPIFNNVLCVNTSKTKLNKNHSHNSNDVVVKIPSNFLTSDLKTAWHSIDNVSNTKVKVVPILNSNLLTRFKSRPAPFEEQCCVYAISCINCASLNNNVPIISYVGQTSRLLSGRLHSHMLEPNSSVKKHTDSTGHHNLLITKLLSVPDVNVRVICEATLINILEPRWNVYDSSPLLLLTPILKIKDKTFLKIHFINLVIKHYKEKMSTLLPATPIPSVSPPKLSKNLNPLCRRSRRIANMATSSIL